MVDAVVKAEQGLDRFRSVLNAKESEIVSKLLAAGGEIVRREELLLVLAGRAPRTLDTYIKQIRAKMRGVGLSDRMLTTHAGTGYSFHYKP
ncbi:MAG TPA: helix-turn-helix domain-containing protein [Candidatus Rubrimentiphilum sp.]|nr:helix-turn-helix domain-containing protein [Candidatus Rubrimentiphilum sp.]